MSPFFANRRGATPRAWRAAPCARASPHPPTNASSAIDDGSPGSSPGIPVLPVLKNLKNRSPLVSRRRPTRARRDVRAPPTRRARRGSASARASPRAAPRRRLPPRAPLNVCARRSSADPCRRAGHVRKSPPSLPGCRVAARRSHHGWPGSREALCRLPLFVARRQSRRRKPSPRARRRAPPTRRRRLCAGARPARFPTAPAFRTSPP